MSATERRQLPPRRVRRGELVCAGAALALLILMFATAWFGVGGIPGRSQLSTAENAWHGLTYVRWLMLLTILASIGSLFLHASQVTHGAETDTSTAITVLGTLTAIALVYRVLIDLPSPPSVVDQKLGAYLGLLCAVAIAIGGYDALRAARRAELLRKQAAAAPEPAQPSATPAASASSPATASGQTLPQ